MIGIAGASGLIGEEFYLYCRKYSIDVMGTYCCHRKRGLNFFDISKGDFSIFKKCKYVLICSAVTDIDECRRSYDKVYDINVVKTIGLIQWCMRQGIIPIFISSDQVFDGQKGFYSENDTPYPINHYGQFKLEVEKSIIRSGNDYVIVRLSKTYTQSRGLFSQVYDSLCQGKQIMAAVNQIYNPTDMSLVCRVLEQMININLHGLYHLASPYSMSRYEFACRVADSYGFSRDLIIPVDINAMGLLEKRPLNTSLNIQLLQKYINFI